MSVSLAPLQANDDLQSLIRGLQRIFSDLEEQLQLQPALIINSDPAKPLKRGGANDLSINFSQDGSVSFQFLKPDKSYYTITLNQDLNGFKGNTSAAAAASTTQYPNNGDWGFHTDTAGVTLKLVRNVSGVIKSATLT